MHDAEEHMVALTDTLDRGDGTLRYAALGPTGAGPALLFTHGAGSDHHVFDPQAVALASRGHRVVVWDLRGHGSSSRGSSFSAEAALDDMRALVSHVGLRKPVLVGHSLGGNLSQALVKQAPTSFSGLVVIGAAWNTDHLSSWDRFLLALSGPLLAMVPARSLAGMMASASAVTETARRDAVRAFSQVTKAEFMDVWRATTTLLQPDPAYRTPVPLCLVRGAQDKTGTISRTMPRWALTEGVAEHVVPDAGHLVTQDAPAAVTTIIEDFLRRAVD
jgi:pimeloyl-ACP methyl ester carboxylesterase